MFRPSEAINKCWTIERKVEIRLSQIDLDALLGIEVLLGFLSKIKCVTVSRMVVSSAKIAAVIQTYVEAQ